MKRFSWLILLFVGALFGWAGAALGVGSPQVSDYVGVGFAIRDAQGNISIVPLAGAVESTPLPATNTPTLTPPATATAIPSLTPQATATGAPTQELTPVPTVTPGNTTIPKPTETPGATATPAVVVCVGTTLVNLNMRSAPEVPVPSAPSNIIRTLPFDTVVTITKMIVYEDAVSEWAGVTLSDGTTGYVKSYNGGARYLDWDDTADVCLPDIMPIEYKTNPLPSTALLWGWHILVGSNTTPVSSTLNTWGVAKALTDSGASVEGLKRVKPELVTVWRSLFTCMGMTDGPTFQQWDDPQGYYNCMKPYWPDGYTYYEPVNEVGAPRGTAQFTDMMIALATLASRDGKCILAYSYPAGNPELIEWGEVLRFMRWANDHPCGNWPDRTPKYHGIALHQSMYLPASIPLKVGQWINNSWVAGRDVLVDNQLSQAFGFSLADFKGGIWLTEAGYDDGYSGSWSDVWTCDEMAAGIKESALRYQDRPWIYAVMIWTTVGQGTRWTDRSECVDEIARALQ